MPSHRADALAGRFVRLRGTWIDLASGTPVSLRLRAPRSRADEFAWADRCSSLARLRHPVLNVLIDYGDAGEGRTFEAWRADPPLAIRRSTHARWLAHALRLVEAHAVQLTASILRRMVRPWQPAVRSRYQPDGAGVGRLLQPRPALDAIADALRASSPGGVDLIAVRADAGSGLRTVRELAPRLARLEGYVPLAERVLLDDEVLAAFPRHRHVVIFADRWEDARAGGARDGDTRLVRFLVELGRESPRRHVLLTFTRDAVAGRHVIDLDRMGAARMRAMIWRDSVEGPAESAIHRAIRRADGRPGAAIAYLTGEYGRAPSAPPVVHETSPAYGRAAGSERSSEGGIRQRPSGRGLAVAHRAASRGERLSGAGRHAAAIRVLRRAVRVLETHGSHEAAGEAALALAWVLRDRGRSRDARHQATEAQRLAHGAGLALRAAVALGVLDTDESRLCDAEALLRSTVAAADVAGLSADSRHAAAALARAVLWQGRPMETLALLRPVLATGSATAAEWALAARAHLSAGSLDSAAQAASNATASARAREHPRSIAAAARATTLVRAALGDSSGAAASAAEGLAAAARAHLPLLALRMHLALASAGRPDTRSVRAINRIRKAPEGSVPALLRQEAERAAVKTAAITDPMSGPPPYSTAWTMGQLRELLETTQNAADDVGALQALASLLVDRLGAATVTIVNAGDGREILRAGRPWSGEPTTALRAMAANVVTSSDTMPLECAAPVRFGGETLGAIACRWSAGALVDVDAASAACGAAALAAAGSLRGLADRKDARPPDAAWENILGNSAGTTRLRNEIANASRAPFPVLILGESGSGKELVARAIHRLGSRRHRRLCTINCAALSDELVEAELFGHTKGAFTGATAERAGLFEEADGGTLFLDEVGELSPRAQAKLLRVLQDGEVRRVGENLPRRVDTRVIAATNRHLEAEVDAGRFRADLRFRLDVIRIVVPPLRERATDIPSLVAHFWQDATAQVGSRATLAPETVAALTRYEWPGNVRELQNAVASIAVQGPRRGRILPCFLPHSLSGSTAPADAPFETAREEFERRYVRAALARAGGHQARAARALGLSRQGLSKMLRRLRIDPAERQAG